MDISSAPLQSKSHLLPALPSSAVQLVWDLPTLDASKPGGESLHEGDRELIRIYHTPLISPLVHPNIFFHKFPEDVLPHRFCNFHVCAVFHKMAKVFCGTSRDFQQKIALFTQQTQGLLSKMTKQSKQSSRLESSKYLLSHNMNIATLDKQSFRN